MCQPPLPARIAAQVVGHGNFASIDDWHEAGEGAEAAGAVVVPEQDLVAVRCNPIDALR